MTRLWILIGVVGATVLAALVLLVMPLRASDTQCGSAVQPKLITTTSIDLNSIDIETFLAPDYRAECEAAVGQRRLIALALGVLVIGGGSIAIVGWTQEKALLKDREEKAD